MFNDTIQEVLRRSKITSQVKDESLDEKQVFQIYYDFSVKQLQTCKVTITLPLIVVKLGILVSMRLIVFYLFAQLRMLI